jgi:hypothetical protein
MGFVAEPSVPVLMQSLKSFDIAENTFANSSGQSRTWSPGFRTAVLFALGEIAPRNTNVSSAALTVLNDGIKNGTVLYAVADVIQFWGRVQDPPEDQVAALILSAQAALRKFYEFKRNYPQLNPKFSLNRRVDPSKCVLWEGADSKSASAMEIFEPPTTGLPYVSNIERLKEYLNDDVELTRLNALHMLGLMGRSDADISVPILIRLLGSTNFITRLRTIEELRSLGNKATNALPRLKSLQQDPVGAVSVWAKKTANEIDRGQ